MKSKNPPIFNFIPNKNFRQFGGWRGVLLNYTFMIMMNYTFFSPFFPKDSLMILSCLTWKQMCGLLPLRKPWSKSSTLDAQDPTINESLGIRNRLFNSTTNAVFLLVFICSVSPSVKFILWFKSVFSGLKTCASAAWQKFANNHGLNHYVTRWLICSIFFCNGNLP